jgi:hypothetical protein
VKIKLSIPDTKLEEKIPNLDIVKISPYCEILTFAPS